MEFCCDKFRFYYSGDKGMGLNIRVIKFNPEYVQRARLKRDKNVWLTEGYSGSIQDCMKRILLNFCPFCGDDLSYIYESDDEFVQEYLNDNG